MEIPTYDVIIAYEENGVDRISLVLNPAVESNFVAFSKQNEHIMFSANEEKQMITGVLLRADYPILRIDADMGKYYIKFSPETIRLTAEKMLKEGNHNHINIEHIPDSDINGVELQEIFIKDTEKGIDPKGFEDISNGSLFATYKVNNSKVWEYIKKGTFKGFSIEGSYAFEVEEEVDTEYDEIMAMIDKLERIKNRK